MCTHTYACACTQTPCGLAEFWGLWTWLAGSWVLGPPDVVTWVLQSGIRSSWLEVWWGKMYKQSGLGVGTFCSQDSWMETAHGRQVCVCGFFIVQWQNSCVLRITCILCFFMKEPVMNISLTWKMYTLCCDFLHNLPTLRNHIREIHGLHLYTYLYIYMSFL